MESLRLLAGKIANLHWILDQKSAQGWREVHLNPIREELDQLLTVFNNGLQYHDCAAPDFIDDDLFDDFYFERVR